MQYLEGAGHPAEAAASLDTLVAQVWKIESDFWQENDPYGDRFGSPIPFWGCIAFILLLLTGLYFLFS